MGFTQFFRSRYAAVGYLDFAFVNFDPFKHRFHDFTLRGQQALFKAFDVFFCGSKTVFNFQFACLRRCEFGIEKFQAFRRIGGAGRTEFLAVCASTSTCCASAS